MKYKRITLLSGHYGSGKTNIAVNMALELAAAGRRTALADLDVVNPYFRSADSREALSDAGIRLICSEYAHTNIDAPALPQEMSSIVDDAALTAVIDVGGDERGALALGRISDRIREEGDYEMYLVINKYRPLTPDAESVLEVKNEIEAACRLPFTGIINCSNLGAETTAETVVSSVSYAAETARLTGLPLVATAVEERLARELSGRIENLLPMRLQSRPV